MIIHRIIFRAYCIETGQISSKVRASIFKRSRILTSHKHYSTQVDNKLDTNKACEIPIENIRNFSIIAHVDHGKSTLADRLLEMTGAIKTNSGKQVLDKLQVEKERGITVKAQTASLNYNYKGEKYLLNLIDTPGHVDFSAEVQRSLVPCQGVILVVDANDGVQAQTVANYYLAIQRDLTVIPVINKIDLKIANPKRVLDQLQSLFNINENDVLKISAKFGTGVDKLLDAVVERIKPPAVVREDPFRALIFDSWYNKYKGAISLIYITEGSLSVGQNIISTFSKKCYEVKALSLLRPDEESVTTLFAGQIGCLSCSMKTFKEAFVGDTIYLKGQTVQPLLGIEQPKPMVFSGVYPIDQSQYIALQLAIEKLTLNDNSVSICMESSAALGRGWRIGFLGLLHMEVFIQRLEQEYNAEPVVTAPGVTYKAKIFGQKNIAKYDGEEISFNNPINFPDPQIVSEYYEPMVLGTVIAPEEYTGEVISLCMERRGVEKECKNIGNGRLMLRYLLPLNEIIVDFHDVLKSITSGYASFDYEDQGYKPSRIVKLCIALNGNVVEELSTIVHASRALTKAKKLCEKLVDLIPRQQFEIVIQAKVGTTILARQNIKAYRKDVTAKLYGGDVTRRMKLLAKQAEGKKKLKMIGNISLPRDTFINVLKR